MTRKVPGFEDPSASERRACLCTGMPVMQGTYNNVFVAGPFEVTEEECIIFWDKSNAQWPIVRLQFALFKLFCKLHCSVRNGIATATKISNCP
jgi:hypothetical protein